MAVSVASCTLDNVYLGRILSPEEDDNRIGVEGQLAIPEYQRPYCWTEQQLDRLLNDMRDHQQSSTQCPYYLGSIILHQQEGRLNIIDGQQRLTSIALIAFATGMFSDFSMAYESPESQRQIQRNLGWLTQRAEARQAIDLSSINVTVVVTDSEDEAYRFFETQNTGGVRLAGPDIIKAHHLRAIHRQDPTIVNMFAARWESLGDLNVVVDLLLRGRYWQQLRFREYPLHNQSAKIRSAIVSELATLTGQGDDIGFGRIMRQRFADGREALLQPRVGYDLRQPLNSGINTIHYLQYFETLRQTYLVQPHSQGELSDFSDFYLNFVSSLKGCGYLKQLFDACLLLYLSVHGQQDLAIAANKIFRVVYSRRVSNQKAVKERSVPAFLRDHPVLDWIAMSYTPKECLAQFDQFHLTVDASGLDKNSVKKRFMQRVEQYYSFIPDETQYAQSFEEKFSACIKALVLKTLGGHCGK